MGRSALTPSRGSSLSRGPQPAALTIPAISVLVATGLAALPIVSNHGWWPDAGFLMLIAWRLQRAPTQPSSTKSRPTSTPPPNPRRHAGCW